jgi:hypothetical protein
VIIDFWSLAFGLWPLVLGLGSLVFGRWALVINFRRLNLANPVPALRDGKDNLKNTVIVSSAYYGTPVELLGKSPALRVDASGGLKKI